MEGGCEADFAGLFGVGLERWGLDGAERKQGRGERTPLRADFAARLALALCLPPIGAVEHRVSIFLHDTRSWTRLESRAPELRAARRFPFAPNEKRLQCTSFL